MALECGRAWTTARCEVHPRPWGEIVANARFPLIYMVNHARVRALPAGGLDALLADVDGFFADRHVGHRELVFLDPVLGHSLQETFVALGYGPKADVTMVRLGNAPCIKNPDVTVVEATSRTGRADFDTIQTALCREEGYSDEVARQLGGVRDVRQRTLGERPFVAYLDRKPAGTFNMWKRGDMAMVEDVGTHPDFRRRGVGRTMIEEATAEAAAMGAQWVALFTDPSRVARGMYESLGFVVTGEIRRFLKTGGSGAGA